MTLQEADLTAFVLRSVSPKGLPPLGRSYLAEQAVKWQMGEALFCSEGLYLLEPSSAQPVEVAVKRVTELVDAGRWLFSAVPIRKAEDFIEAYALPSAPSDLAAVLDCYRSNTAEKIQTYVGQTPLIMSWKLNQMSWLGRDVAELIRRLELLNQNFGGASFGIAGVAEVGQVSLVLEKALALVADGAPLALSLNEGIQQEPGEQPGLYLNNCCFSWSEVKNDLCPWLTLFLEGSFKAKNLRKKITELLAKEGLPLPLSSLAISLNEADWPDSLCRRFFEAILDDRTCLTLQMALLLSSFEEGDEDGQ